MTSLCDTETKPSRGQPRKLLLETPYLYKERSMKTRRIMILTVGLLLLAQAAVAANRYPEVANYNIDAAFTPAEARMEARVSITLAPEEYPLDTVTFYLHGELEVDSVKIRRETVKFQQELVFYNYEYSSVANKCDFDLTGLNADDTIVVFYSGYFNPSKVRSPSDYMCIDETGVYLRSYGYSIWFPIFLPPRQDEYRPSFNLVRLRAPVGFHGVFAGHKQQEFAAGDWQVSEWTAPELSIFDAQCTIHPFETVKSGPVSIYYWQDSVSKAMAGSILDFTTQITGAFRELYNPTAEAGELHIAELVKYGDISSGNMVGISDDVWRKFETELYPKLTLAHELVHEFVSVDIPRSDPLYALAIEGFPSYFDHPALERILGTEWYQTTLEALEKRYVEYKVSGLSRRGNKLPSEKPLDQITADEIGTYKDLFLLADRALLFLNYLRVKAGDEKFVEFCRKLFSGGKLDNETFRQLAVEHTGVSREDIDLWLSTNEYPKEMWFRNLK